MELSGEEKGFNPLRVHRPSRAFSGLAESRGIERTAWPCFRRFGGTAGWPNARDLARANRRCGCCDSDRPLRGCATRCAAQRRAVCAGEGEVLPAPQKVVAPDTTASVREAIAPPIASAEQVEATSGVKVMRGNGGPPKALIIDVARASLLNPKSPPSGLEDLFRAPLPGLPPRAPRSPRQKAQIDADEQPLEAPARTLGRNERAFDSTDRRAARLA